MLSQDAQAEMAAGRGAKDDRGKVMLSLIPAEATMAIGEVFTYGCKKYSADNWRNGMSYRRMQDAAERHLKMWQLGQELDPESGLHHLAHMGCCVMMLLTWTLDPKRYGQNDDRYKTEGTQGELGV